MPKFICGYGLQQLDISSSQDFWYICEKSLLTHIYTNLDFISAQHANLVTIAITVSIMGMHNFICNLKIPPSVTHFVLEVSL